ncbi:MAG: hypothetical protein DHS20C13_04570 [Thermodesulfobacteriota bacterium]|nr:MAG: hypothetical protein DHS20C13_04570 [Thermodesulfobacteriota bacterium]
MALYGIYGKHTTEACPWNNIETAKKLKEMDESDLASRASEFKISHILGQYHSALEHTFLWLVEAEDPHLIQEFCVTTGLASINELKIVPMITFEGGVIPGLKKIHSL